jgi:hypothetical protein
MLGLFLQYWIGPALSFGEELDLSFMKVSGMLSGVWHTINNQLRTGTDKGNLTV